MTTYYPNHHQPTPSFLKKYARNAYNRAQHDAQQYDEAAISLQPYRSTPLILPGAKVHQQHNLPTESYLRHHPNPQMRGPPTHDYTDILMKQKVADSVLQRYSGQDFGQAGGQQQQYGHQQAANGPKLVHKQFNSPIGLYSDNLIESTIKSTVSPGGQSSISANSSSVPIFIDMSFLEQKKRILEQQQASQRQKQQNYVGWSPKPQFNRAVPHVPQQAPRYPPTYYPTNQY